MVFSNSLHLFVMSKGAFTILLSKLKAIVKGNKTIYNLYYHIGSTLLQFIGLFIKTDPNLILFISYGGQKYDDSPKVVYEYLRDHPVSPEHKYVWAFIEPQKFLDVPNKVRVDTLSYYLTAMRAGYWITNSSASRGLNFKKATTKNVLFQHGMAGIKKIGIDIGQADKAFSLGFRETFDYIFVEGCQEVSILTHAWQTPASVFHTTGLPRNDNLTDITPNEVVSIKQRLGLPLDKKVILYAPTFREFSKASNGLNALGIPFNFQRWKQEFGKDYVLLVTAHYEVAKLLNQLPDNGFVFNAFKYPEVNDLLKVADLLISDYSSIVFDYSILEKPIFCYGYDYDSYAKERGVYTDLDQLFSHGVCRTEENLITAISNMDYEAECLYTKEKIKEKYIASYGNAAQKSVEIIFHSPVYNG